MTIRKEEVIEMVRQLPDEIDIEELIYRLYLREKIELAEADIVAERTFPLRKLRLRRPSGETKVDSTGARRPA